MKPVVASFCLVLAAVLVKSCAASRTPDNEPDISEQSVTYYSVVVATGDAYDDMLDVIIRFQQASGAVIDSMDRYYNTETKKLVLSDDSEDEIYRGAYFPRRGASETLSIEYRNAVDSDYSGKEFAAVAGVFSTKAEAKSFAAKYKSQFPGISVKRSEMYMGCMH